MYKKTIIMNVVLAAVAVYGVLFVAPYGLKLIVPTILAALYGITIASLRQYAPRLRHIAMWGNSVMLVLFVGAAFLFELGTLQAGFRWVFWLLLLWSVFYGINVRMLRRRVSDFPASTTTLGGVLAEKGQKILAPKRKLWRRFFETRSSRAMCVALAAWSAFVFFRSSGYYQLLGIDFGQWSNEYFWANWLLPPAAVALGWLALRWVIFKDKRDA